MINIQRDPTSPMQLTTGASAPVPAARAPSGDTYVGQGGHGIKFWGTAMLALAALGGASARELRAPRQGQSGLRPMLRQSAGGALGLSALPANATSHRILRALASGVPVAAAPGPFATAPVGAPVPGPVHFPVDAAQSYATPSNWLSPNTAPHGAAAPARQG